MTPLSVTPGIDVEVRPPGKRPSNFGVYGTSANMTPDLATALGATPGG